ncbi:hypothetical protein BC834DRAFT_968352 [Gloeopeniophorella convolvens]|nr:hypothetical protein BC834DRAFT_968352 [Gloeopeniophorella convolvens]
MLEPLRAVALALALRSPARSLLALPAFSKGRTPPTPRPSRSKGKQKAVPAKMTTGSTTLTGSPLPTTRPSPASAPAPPTTTAPSPARALSPPPPQQAKAVRFNDTGQPALSTTPAAILDCFVDGTRAHGSAGGVDLDAAWAAFDQLTRGPAPLEPTLVIRFADQAVAIIEDAPDAPGDRERRLLASLRAVLEALAGDIAPNLPACTHAHCLCARIEALLGRFAEARGQIKWVLGQRAAPDVFRLAPPELRMLTAVLRALFRQQGAPAVLDYVLSSWHALGRFVNASPPRTHRRALSQLHDIVFDIFDHIPSPVAAFAEHGARSETRGVRAGMLLIRYLIHRRVPEDALAVYHEMQRRRLDLNRPLKLWLVRALVQGHAVQQANVLFSKISKGVPKGQEDELFLATALHLFSSQGNVARSEAAFQGLRDRDAAGLRATGMLLLAHAQNGDVATVLRLFEEGFPRDMRHVRWPDVYAYTAVLTAHAKAKDSAGLNKWLREMIADGVKPDRHVYNILLSECADSGALDDVAAVIEEMRNHGLPPLAETYTTVIAALAKRGDPVAAEAYYKKALREGIKPDRQMVASLMMAHSEVGSWEGVIRAFDYMASSDSRQLRPRIDVYNILLHAYVLAGSPFEVVADVFSKMEASGVRPTAHTFSILIMSACDSGQMDVARRIFAELDALAQQWETGLAMNVYALTILMAGYLRLGDRDRAKEVYDEMLVRGIEPSSVTYTTILSAYTVEGSAESIRLASDYMRSLVDGASTSAAQQRALVATYGRFSGLEHVYGPLMTLFARTARPAQAEALLDDMVRAGGTRTLAALTLLLNAHRNARDADACRRVWAELFPRALRHFAGADALFAPDAGAHAHAHAPRVDLQRRAHLLCAPLSIHLDALSAAGAHADAAAAWRAARAAGFALDAHNWNHLVVVLVRAGELERAFLVVERVLLPFARRAAADAAAAAAAATATGSTSAPRAHVPSPLLYDDAPPPPPADTGSADAVDAADVVDAPALPRDASAAERAAAVARARLLRIGADVGVGAGRGDERAAAPDFAHPLHVLQQILPSWSAWRPHAAVVALLADQRGAEALLGDAPLAPGWHGAESEAAAARGVLARIHAACPRAVAVVMEHEYRVRVRRELAEMVDEG